MHIVSNENKAKMLGGGEGAFSACRTYLYAAIFFYIRRPPLVPRIGLLTPYPSLQNPTYLERTRTVGSDRLIFGVPLRPAAVHDRNSIMPKNPLYMDGKGPGGARGHVGK